MTALRDWEPTAEHSIGTGTTLLEASAGTGKTYNITSVLLRLVAARNIKMREIVVVTFTRAATAELQDRIRVRLSDAVAFLEGRSRVGDGDEVLEHLRAGARKAGGEIWLRRLRAAQESFDECLISTIHGFCQRMLQQHAFESQTDFDLELVQDNTEL
jgi:exodeoxyribonuclease V beta subunit